MKRLVTVSVIFALAIGGAACKKKKDKDKGTGETTTTSDAPKPPDSKPPEGNPPATADAGAAAASTTGFMNKMANCPSAIEGATTTVKDVEGGVELDIVGKTDADATEIRGRMKKLLETAKGDSSQIKHTGEGTGGGGSGHCPVVVKGTVVTAEDMDKGSKVTVKPADPAGLDALKKTITERNEAMKGTGGGERNGTGGGKEDKKGGKRGPGEAKGPAGGDGSGTGGGTGGGGGHGQGGGTGGGDAPK